MSKPAGPRTFAVMLLVCRFDVPDERRAEFTDRATRALELLTAQPGCLRGALGRSSEHGERWVLTVEFESIVAYRKALSPFDVREVVIPLLSEALTDEPAGYEVLVDARDGTANRRESVLAEDAGATRVGEAGGPAQAR